MSVRERSARIQRYEQLGPALAGLSAESLSKQLSEASNPAGSHWGKHQLIKVAGKRVFMKRIPVTNLEIARPFSTRNLYGLPEAYHYGVGSVGFGVYRELVTHIKASHWVLAGEWPDFPLLYHYRIVPLAARSAGFDHADYEQFVEYWGQHAGIARYLRERMQARHELQLFLEYIPQTLRDWLYQYPDQHGRVLAALKETIGFLRRRGLLHLDPHYLNVLTDGERFYLSDFGLAIDRSFELDQAERNFFARHRNYDDGQIIWSLCYVLRDRFSKSPAQIQRRILKRYALSPALTSRELFAALLARLEDLHASDLLKLAPAYVACLLAYRPIVALMHEFYADLQANPAKDTPFRHRSLGRLLKAAGWQGELSPSESEPERP